MKCFWPLIPEPRRFLLGRILGGPAGGKSVSESGASLAKVAPTAPTTESLALLDHEGLPALVLDQTGGQTGSVPQKWGSPLAKGRGGGNPKTTPMPSGHLQLEVGGGCQD